VGTHTNQDVILFLFFLSSSPTLPVQFGLPFGGR
jgi:hypothetical protein